MNHNDDPGTDRPISPAEDLEQGIAGGQRREQSSWIADLRNLVGFVTPDSRAEREREERQGRRQD